MVTAPPSDGGKPSDQFQNVRTGIAHHLQQVSFKNSTPAAADIQNSARLTVAKNRLENSQLSHANSGSNLTIQKPGESPPHKGSPTHHFSAHSTVEFVPSDLLQITSVTEITGDTAPAVQIEKNCVSSQGVRRNDTFISEQIGTQPTIGISSATPNDNFHHVSGQFPKENDHSNHLKSSELAQLTGHGVPGKFSAQNQCRIVSAPQGNVLNQSKQILHWPISSNHKKGSSEHCSITGKSSINPPAQLERREDSGAQNQPIPPTSQSLVASTAAMVEGGKEVGQEEAIDGQEGKEQAAVNTLASTPLDEYKPIQSEDEMSGGIEEENDDKMSEASKDEQHYNLLVSAVNGEYQQEIIGNQGLSPRKYNPSPRLTRSKAAGIRTSSVIERLKTLIKIHKISLIAVLEPFLDTPQINHYKIQMSMNHAISNTNNKIWIFWDQDFTGTVLDQDEQQITLEMKHVEAA
ncbi:hypothetical protein A4A49_08479 [Nicotiana attenuata]|uniref:Uncharacterized protein n=1 Tax=Nicotiana attenuata TaxID=49451 RepID=A0A1J6IP01_NICAT|nr:hypothetical protein A4A49_08479 [Nicotiana attenuata]